VSSRNPRPPDGGPRRAVGAPGAAGWDEDALTRRFAELVGPPRGELVLGVGDDCAVLRPDPEEDLCWTVDSLEEGVDFRREWLSLEEVGARAVAVALSDIAAAGGRPLAVLFSLGSAGPAVAEELLGLFEGAARAARGWGVAVAGGDLTRRERGVGVTVSALGAVPRGRALLRSGARAGDEIWVTGRLGLARAGLRLLREVGREGALRENRAAFERYAHPSPRLAEGAWLSERAPISACLDLSDGAARDLSRLCAASRVAARLEAEAVLAAAALPGERGLQDALFGGEDFELLVTIPLGGLAEIAPEFSRRFDLPLTRIGEVLEGSGVVLRTERGERPLAAVGWDHVQGGEDHFGGERSRRSKGEGSPPEG